MHMPPVASISVPGCACACRIPHGNATRPHGTPHVATGAFRPQQRLASHLLLLPVLVAGGQALLRPGEAYEAAALRLRELHQLGCPHRPRAHAPTTTRPCTTTPDAAAGRRRAGGPAERAPSPARAPPWSVALEPWAVTTSQRSSMSRLVCWVALTPTTLHRVRRGSPCRLRAWISARHSLASACS